MKSGPGETNFKHSVMEQGQDLSVLQIMPQLKKKTTLFLESARLLCGNLEFSVLIVSPTS